MVDIGQQKEDKECTYELR